VCVPRFVQVGFQFTMPSYLGTRVLQVEQVLGSGWALVRDVQCQDATGCEFYVNFSAATVVVPATTS
jgi:hypothetical protein